MGHLNFYSWGGGNLVMCNMGQYHGCLYTGCCCIALHQNFANNGKGYGDHHLWFVSPLLVKNITKNVWMQFDEIFRHDARSNCLEDGWGSHLSFVSQTGVVEVCHLSASCWLFLIFWSFVAGEKLWLLKASKRSQEERGDVKLHWIEAMGTASCLLHDIYESQVGKSEC